MPAMLNAFISTPDSRNQYGSTNMGKQRPRVHAAAMAVARRQKTASKKMAMIGAAIRNQHS